MAANRKYIELLDRAFEEILTRDSETALNLCEDAMKIAPERAEHLFMLGIVSLGFNDAGRAVKFMEEGHRREPDWLEFVQALTTLNAEIGNLSDSLYYSKLELITESNPDVKNWMPDSFGDFAKAIDKMKVPTYLVDGWIEFHERKYTSAAAFCEREMVINPDNPECYFLYGRASLEMHELERALDALRTAIEHDGDNLQYRLFYADAQLNQGLVEQSVVSCREALKIHPQSIELRLRLICALAYRHGADWAECNIEMDVLGQQLTGNFQNERQGRGEKRPDSKRPDKICVGFLVNEFALTEYADFLTPIFRCYDHSRFRVVGYQQYSQPFSGTAIFSKAVDDWIRAYDINDPTLAHIIANDNVDVIVDLCGVQPGNRISLLAALEGVVRVSWLGFPVVASPAWTDAILWNTGLRNTTGSFVNSTRVYDVGESLVCYSGGSASLEIVTKSQRSTDGNGSITFGAALDLKVIPQSIEIWAKVLRTTPGSRLLLGGRGAVFDGTKRRVHDLFTDFGVEQRVFVHEGADGQSSLGQFLSEIDILLDSEVVSGSAMLADALWSGIPVVTREGMQPSSAIGAAVLRASGLPQWVACEIEDYVRIAAKLAQDAAQLQQSRSGLRELLEQSVLCQTQQFVSRFTDTLEEIWRDAQQ